MQRIRMMLRTDAHGAQLMAEHYQVYRTSKNERHLYVRQNGSTLKIQLARCIDQLTLNIDRLNRSVESGYSVNLI